MIRHSAALCACPESGIMTFTPFIGLPRKRGELRFAIRQITSRSDKLRFVKFPWQVYRGDPYWVPPPIGERLDSLNPQKNRSFDHLDVALFLAESSSALSDNQVVGTIAALINRRHNESQNEKAGFFGLFEVINHQPVATALLETVEEWVQEHLPGVTAIRGPMNPSAALRLNFSPNDVCGTLVDGFNARPLVFTAYNPPYYPELIETAGYVKAMDLLAYRQDTVDFTSPANPYLPEPERVIRSVRERYGLQTRAINVAEMADEKWRLKQIHDSAWEHNRSFVPFTDAEMEFIVGGLLKLIDPRLVLFVEKDGEPIAFGLTLPDVNIPRQKAKGWPFPLRWLRYRLARRQIDWARVCALEVVKEFRGQGVDALLYSETARTAARLGYRHIECSWIPVDDQESNRMLQSLGACAYKTYRIYEKALA
jgi:GNAT superfamily N-acetyltransferase